MAAHPFIFGDVHNPFVFGASFTSVIPLLLDLYPNAAAAYSLRKLRNAYSGAAIRVRRSSDNAEDDIGFIGNNLDTAALLAFTGAGNGFVTTWYDQSGAALNALQASAVNQPQIVSSGVVVIENGLPALDWGVNKGLILSSNLVLTNQQYFIVLKNTNEITPASSRQFVTVGNAEGPMTTCLLSFGNTTGTIVSERLSWILAQSSLVYGIANNSANIPASQKLISCKYLTDTTQELYLNNSLQSVVSPGVTWSGGAGPYTTAAFPRSFRSIGNSDALNDGLLGKFQEFIVYPSDQTVNQNGISGDINGFYTIY